LLYVDISQGLWRGLGGGGSLFWLHTETLTFMGPGPYQNTAAFQIEVDRIPPNFDILFVVSISYSAI